MLRHSICNNYNCLPLSGEAVLPLQRPRTLDKTVQTPSVKRKAGPKLDIPAKLQVGAHRAAVYTTKIMLALARVSKQQSQPFMVRVEINIAQSRAVEWGARHVP